jgi:predicted MFS family arabinose efflux permease
LLGVGTSAALVALTLAVLTGLGTVALWQVALLALLVGSTQVFDMPARTALAVDLVGRQALARAVALNAVAFYLFGAIGAYAAGQVIPRYGVSGAYLLIAGCHLIGLVLVASLRDLPRLIQTAHVPISLNRTLVDGWRLTRDNPGVRMVVVASVCVELFGYSYQSAVPPLARDVLMVGPEGLGMLSAAASVGATISTVLLTLLPASVRRQPVLAGVILTWGVAQVGLGLAPAFVVALAAMALAGGCSAAVDALQQTLVQLAVPEEQRGRAMGVWVCSIGTNSFGYFQVGQVGGAFGPAASLLFNGAMAALSSIFVQAVAPTYRWRGRPALATASD